MLYSKIDTSKRKEVLFLEFYPDLICLMHRYKRQHSFENVNDAIEHMVLTALNMKTAK